jgi:dihydropteroate synthase
MGVLNVSPESFHAGSVRVAGDDLVAAALAMAEAGAVLVDVGARSTAPYLDTAISDEDECRRLARAIEVLAPKLPVPISADTARPRSARAALDAGARVINDVSGLRDPAVAALVADRRVGLILMASPVGVGTGLLQGVVTGLAPGVGSHPKPDNDDRFRIGPHARREPGLGDRREPGPSAAGPISRSGGPAADDSGGGGPVEHVRGLLAAALARARAAGIPEERVVLDPGIGFFRNQSIPWDEWDARVLAKLGALEGLGRPLCVGVSRKSFVGAITGRPSTEDRLAGSLAATAVAVWNGASLVRAHDVAETLDAVRVAERLRERSGTL